VRSLSGSGIAALASTILFADPGRASSIASRLLTPRNFEYRQFSRLKVTSLELKFFVLYANNVPSHPYDPSFDHPNPRV
jgi:hypothetical protein